MNFKKLSGFFSIEMAMILPIIISIIFFTFKSSYLMVLESRLDNASYYSVSLIKDRTLLFNGEHHVSNAESEKLYDFLKENIGGIYGLKQIGLTVNSVVDNDLKSYSYGIKCEDNNNINTNSSMIVYRKDYRGDFKQVPIYQVILCSKLDNLLSIKNNLISSSIMVAR